MIELLILIFGSVGAWLLFAGPLLQAALELNEQDIERERIRATHQKAAVSRHVSSWRWLLPPVKLLLEQRQSWRYQKEYVALLSAEDLAAMVNFMSKAQGWLYVAAGALLIALKETYELTHYVRWSLWIFVMISVVVALASLLNTVRFIIVIKKTANKKSTS